MNSFHIGLVPVGKLVLFFYLNKANVIRIGALLQEELDGLWVVAANGPVERVHALVVLVVDVRPAVQEEGEDVQIAAEACHHQRAAPKPVPQTTALQTALGSKLL
jgi:hypothetical protein